MAKDVLITPASGSIEIKNDIDALKVTVVADTITTSNKVLTLPNKTGMLATTEFVQTAIGDYVPTTRTVNGKTLSNDIILSATDIGLGKVTNESKTTMFTSPVFTGTPWAVTAAKGINTSQIATTEFVQTAIGDYVPTTRKVNGKTLSNDIILSATDIGLGNVTNESKTTMFTSPVFTGTPWAVTAAKGINTSQIATTEFVQTAIGDYVPTTRKVNGKTLSNDIILSATDIGLGNVTNESKTTMFTSPVFTGTPWAVTAAKGINTSQIATTEFVQTAIGDYVPTTRKVNGKTLSNDIILSATDIGLGNVTNESKTTMFTSPVFTGTPWAVTAAKGINTSQIATTEFVQTAIGDYVPTTRKVNGKTLSSDITLSLDDILDGSTRKWANKADIDGYYPLMGAGTSDKLATAITIGGVSFDGSTNINLPGVNTAGNQNTSGNAATATKLATASTIGLGTGVTSTATSFDGSSNITIPVTSISESYLSWGGKGVNGQVTPIGMSLSNEHSANRLAFINGASLYFEYSSDGGSTWTDYGYSAPTKSQFCTASFGVPIGRTSAATEYTTLSRTRVTLTAQNGTTGYVYTNPRKMLLETSSSGGMEVLVETRTGTNYQSAGAWSTFGTYTLSGWSGWNDIPLVLGTLGGGTTQTGNNWQLRLTFIMTSKNASYPTNAYVQKLRIYGENAWNTPSTMAATNNLYSFDMSQNATFPGTIQGTQLKSTVATGTSPLTVASTTVVPNLNADLLDGQHGSYYQPASTAITTANIGSQTVDKANKLATARTFTITDYDATHSQASATNFDGSSNFTIKLPETIKASLMGTASGNLTSSSYLDATKLQGTIPEASLLDASIPVVGMVETLLKNISGKGLTSYTRDTSHMSDSYPYTLIEYQLSNAITEEQAKAYMRSILGVTWLPQYDYAWPKNIYIIDGSGIVWKPQWTNVLGTYELRMYYVTQITTNLTLSTALTNYVPTTRKVNGKTLSSDIILSATDIGLGNVTNESKTTMFTSPVFTGTPWAVTAAKGINTSQIATTEFVQTAIGDYVPTTRKVNGKTLSNDIILSATDIGLGNVTNESKTTMFTSPVFTGTPWAVTAAKGINTSQIATTEFVQTAIGDYVPTTRKVNGKTLSNDIILSATDIGLGNVTNESKTTMFTSPVFTGTPWAVTAAKGINTSQIATTEFVQTAIGDYVAKNTAITGATKTKITYDSKGLITGGADLVASDIPALAYRANTWVPSWSEVSGKIGSAYGTTSGTFAEGNHTHNYAGSATAGGAATSATKLATARTLTIGAAGKTFNGGADITWSLADIGLVTTFGSTPTDTSFPSTKLVYDTVIELDNRSIDLTSPLSVNGNTLTLKTKDATTYSVALPNSVSTYAPTTAGSSGQFLISTGENNPIWTSALTLNNDGVRIMGRAGEMNFDGTIFDVISDYDLFYLAPNYLTTITFGTLAETINIGGVNASLGVNTRVNFLGTTQATSSDASASFAGGVKISKKLLVVGDITTSGNIIADNTTTQTDTIDFINFAPELSGTPWSYSAPTNRIRKYGNVVMIDFYATVSRGTAIPPIQQPSINIPTEFRPSYTMSRVSSSIDGVLTDITIDNTGKINFPINDLGVNQSRTFRLYLTYIR